MANKKMILNILKKIVKFNNYNNFINWSFFVTNLKLIYKLIKENTYNRNILVFKYKKLIIMWLNFLTENHLNIWSTFLTNWIFFNFIIIKF